MVEIFLIAVSLALDAFAVSVSSGISIPGFGPRQAVKMGLWFGTFQFLMPLLGWLLGSSVSQYIEAVDHWVAFGLLAVIGFLPDVFIHTWYGGMIDAQGTAAFSSIFGFEIMFGVIGCIALVMLLRSIKKHFGASDAVAAAEDGESAKA